MEERVYYISLYDYYGKLLTDKQRKYFEDYFFDDLYRGFRIDRIPAKRYINRDGNNRGPINEILVRNYGYDISNIGFKDNKLF